MIQVALAYVAFAVVVLTVVGLIYGFRHPATRYTCRPAPRALPKLAPITFNLRGGGTLVARDSVDVMPVGRLTYESPFERWQRESATGRERAPLGFAPRERQPRNRRERRAAAIGGGR